MSQVVHDKYAQLVKANGDEMIPAAIVDAQTRDGKDELIVGAANMQKNDATGRYEPTDKDFPLEARVRELEARLGATVENPAQWTLADRIKRLETELTNIKNTLTDGTQKTTLTGQIPVRGASTVPRFELLGRRQVIVERGTSEDWDENIREIGNVVYDPNNNRFMFVYSGYKGSYGSGNTVYVGYAYSTNGESWTKGGKFTLGQDDRASEDPYLVIAHDGTYYLYVEDKETVPFRAIRCYTSADLVTWTDQGEVLEPDPGTWEATDVSSPVVWLEEENSWYMLYEGRAPSHGGAIGLATSSDGVTWKKSDANPVIRGKGAAFSAFGPPTLEWVTSTVPDDIVKVDDSYLLTLHGYYQGKFQPVVCESKDLIHWNDYLGRPINVGVSTIGDGTAMYFRSHDGDYLVFNYANSGVHRTPIVGFSVNESPVKVTDVKTLETFVVLDAFELRSATTGDAGYFDLSRYRQVEWWVHSTLDQPFILSFTAIPLGSQGLQSVPMIWDPGEAKFGAQDALSSPLVVDGSGRWHKLSDVAPWTKQPMMPMIRVRYRCQVAPTTGAVTVVGIGMPL